VEREGGEVGRGVVKDRDGRLEVCEEEWFGIRIQGDGYFRAIWMRFWCFSEGKGEIEG
jgi:hypothetical protein